MAKIKEVVKKFKMQAPGGTATPAPPIGPALGANGINPGQFITKFNAATAALKGKIVGVEVTVYSDRSFDFVVKTPPASVMIKDAIKIEKGSGEPNKNKVGKITKAQLRKVAEEKLKDLNAYDVEGAIRILSGSARSMGVDVVD
jgi:large subunit ribosomal protein L11